MTGDVLWLTPVVLLVFIGFLHLRRVTALLRARAEEEADGEPSAQPPQSRELRGRAVSTERNSHHVCGETEPMECDEMERYQGS